MQYKYEIDENVVAQWRFNQTTTDSSSNGYDLVKYIGTMSYFQNESTYEGYSGGVFSTNNKWAAVTVGENLKGTSGWVIEGYVTFASLPSEMFNFCIGQATNPHILIMTYGGSVRLIINDAIKLTSPITPEANVMYYYAIRSNSDDNIEFFFNKAVDKTTRVGSPITDLGAGIWPNNDVITFGYVQWAIGTWNFNGYMDYITVSNVARTRLPSQGRP